MVETINPVVHRGRARWSIAVALHALAAGSSAALFGAGLGAVGAALGAPFGDAGTVLFVLVGTVYAIGELAGRPLPVPQLRRQVPDWWRAFFPGPVAAFLYGIGLGVGFLTYVGHGTLVAVSVLATVSGRPLAGALMIAPFGLARGLSIVRAGRVRTSEDGRLLVDSLAGTRAAGRAAANAGALLTLAASGIVAAEWPGNVDWAEAAGAAVAVIFAWSSASKLVGRRRWERTLRAHMLPDRLERVARRGVPAAEALVPVLALLGYGRTAALWAAILLTVFSVHLVQARVLGRKSVPCGCFGGRRSQDVRLALLRNAGLASAALVATMVPNAPRWAWPGFPAPSEILPMVLACMGLALAVWTAWRAATWLGRAVQA